MMVSFMTSDAAVQKAAELCSGKSQRGIYQTITEYINNSFDYVVDGDESWISYAEETFKRKSGACLDLSTLACVMLRSQGIACMLNVGKASNGKEMADHAWVIVYIDGKEEFYDPTADILAIDTSKYSYTASRIY